MTRISGKAASFTESVIREMTREALKHGAVNLSQGFPDFAAPEDIKRVAMQAIEDDINQYAITWGARDFREAIANKTKWYLRLDIDPETELTVTCGSTEGMIAAMMATVDPQEEVVLFEPFYENYAPDAILSDAKPRYVPLRPPDWSFDREELRSVFNRNTKAIIVCNPNNPTGTIYGRRDWEAFLERVLPGEDLRAFVQRAAGYSATGDTSEQCMFIHHGPGANGTYTESGNGAAQRTASVPPISADGSTSPVGWAA